jgi:hypothetical protein
MAQRPPKKNFKGETKKSDDYDGDWVLHNNAWKTKKQRKSDIQDLKENRARRQETLAAAAAPVPAPGTPPPPPATAPILTGVVNAPGHVNTPRVPDNIPPRGAQPKPPVPGQPNPPSWWINQAIQNPTTPEQQFANAANAILPTLSPEDQRTLASYLATNYKDVYGGYATTQFSEAPTELDANWRKAFLNPERAQLAVSLLDKMKTAAGGGEMGAGYDYLKNAVNLMNQFSTGGVMTREKYAQFQAAVAALGKNATGELSAYGNLAQLFNLPSFSAGSLVTNEANKKLFS